MHVKMLYCNMCSSQLVQVGKKLLDGVALIETQKLVGGSTEFSVSSDPECKSNCHLCLRCLAAIKAMQINEV